MPVADVIWRMQNMTEDTLIQDRLRAADALAAPANSE
jgi:hypothetical protein